MMTLTKSFRPFAVKAVDESAHTFEGLAATWDLDLGGDIIHKGAFKKSLEYWKEQPAQLPLIDSHQYGSALHSVLGSMTDGEEKDEGLFARFEVDEGEDGLKLLRHIKARRLNGLSIGYEAVNPEKDDKGVRHLRLVKLMEISVVLWPMQPGALIDATSAKSLLLNYTDEEKAELRAALEAEVKAAAEASNPTMTPEQMGALRTRLLKVRLRPLLSRHGEAIN